MNDGPYVKKNSMSVSGALCEIRWGALLTGLYCVLPWLLLEMLTREPRWIHACMVCVLVYACAYREGGSGTALLQVLAIVIVGYLVLFLLQPWHVGFTLVCAILGGGLLWLGNNQVVQFRLWYPVVILALYLACAGWDADVQGIGAVQSGLRLVPFLLVGGMWGIWALIAWGILRSPGTVMAQPSVLNASARSGTAVIPMVRAILCIILAGCLTEVFELAHGQWAIWSAICTLVWLQDAGRQQYAQGMLGVLAGMAPGLIAGEGLRQLLPEHMPVLIAAIPAGIMLARVVLRHYTAGGALQTALAVCGLSLAGETVLPRVGAAIAGVVVVVSIVCLQKLLSGLSLRGRLSRNWRE